MDLVNDLELRMAKPQRHRLLQGYPMVPLMQRACPPRDGARASPRRGADGRLDDGEPLLVLDRSRPLVVGILPHAHCAPTVKGCGFCTFPHSPAYDPRAQKAEQHFAGADISFLGLREPAFAGRRVHALYFGGATANLIDEGSLQDLFTRLSAGLLLSDAEVTLEGVPALFLRRLGDKLGVLADLPAGPKRISMGIQTFSRAWHEKMGRLAFGDGKTFAKVVQRAHGRRMTASGDFLFDLPGQTRDEMLDDVRRAIDIGLDQICLYHLVLYAGLGTPWSEDPAMIAALPTNDEGCANWLALRDLLLQSGFVQTTLTNFERKDVHESPQRFRYEEASFTPETYDGLGLGLFGVSTFVDVASQKAVKLMRMRPKWIEGHRYEALWSGEDLWFPYGADDLRLLFLTRSLPRLRVSRATYRRMFDEDPVARFQDVWDAAGARDLVALDDDWIRLTPRGMFYADSIAGLLAAPRARDVRAHAAGRRTLQVIDERSFYGGMG